MHHTYVTRFDVIGNLKIFWKLNKALEKFPALFFEKRKEIPVT